MSSIAGIKDVTAYMKKLENVGIESAIRKSVEQVIATARNYCPANHGELKQSIQGEIKGSGIDMQGIVYTNKSYAPYVEYGTGPVGQANHSGISPDVNPSYSQTGWWIHESQIDQGDAERYHFFKIETEDGIFYMTDGQPANPFMYPALVDSEGIIEDIFKEELKRTI